MDGIGRALLAKLGKEKQMYDQSILGSGNFVEGLLKKQKIKKKKYRG